jgi:KDO2-lipid IV(A) lauroyltransferase
VSHLISNKRIRKWLRRSGWKNRLSGPFEDAALVAFWALCGRLSPERASRFGAAIVGALGPLTPKQSKIKSNLIVAFPEMSKLERRRVARGVWRNMGASAGEYPHIGKLRRATGPTGAGIVTEIPEHLEANFSGERLTVFATGHLANWEVLATAPKFWGVDLAVVYAPISEGIADRRLRAYRELMGSRLLRRDGSAKALLAHLRSGRPIGIVADFRIDDGELLPFFGSTKKTTLSPARLALKTGADLVAVRVERLGPARFKIGAAGPIRPPADIPDDMARARSMMTAFNRQLEHWIRERPDEWVCGKRCFDKALVKALRRDERQAMAGEIANAP